MLLEIKFRGEQNTTHALNEYRILKRDLEEKEKLFGGSEERTRRSSARAHKVRECPESNSDEIGSGPSGSQTQELKPLSNPLANPSAAYLGFL